MNQPVCIEIEIIESTDPSVQCIHALRQVMDHFQRKNEGVGGGRCLSPLGKDVKAVYAWFMERYDQNITIKISDSR